MSDLQARLQQVRAVRALEGILDVAAHALAQGTAAGAGGRGSGGDAEGITAALYGTMELAEEQARASERYGVLS